eukprot:TRINITY_DN68713_c0_g1_i1.p1 TRINITY_DN68713_c0_g1~~TRINITY_DN68713_c0_g1_i1.p1  ORF type:complete len:302 (-),score=79.98 TRINITY_DN68713_c0_g1_i1:108-1013(-)
MRRGQRRDRRGAFDPKRKGMDKETSEFSSPSGKRRKVSSSPSSFPLSSPRSVPTVPTQTSSSLSQSLRKAAHGKGKKHRVPSYKEKLQGAKFRWLNERLYTTRGEDAFAYFSKNRKDFDAYHEGFRSQVEKWPVHPLSVVRNVVESHPKHYVWADMGCGEAELARTVSSKVHSFDLVAENERVIACDMANTPLKDGEVDGVVFCLSLMGTNLDDFVREAFRILKADGILLVAEVESRFEGDYDTFLKRMEAHGFHCVEKETEEFPFFVYFRFEKKSKALGKREATVSRIGLQLKPCVYKKR